MVQVDAESGTGRAWCRFGGPRIGRALPCLIALVLWATPAATADQHLYVPGQILVKSRLPARSSKLTANLNARGLAHRKTIEQLGVQVFQAPDQSIDSLLAQLRADPEIEFAERDGVAMAAAVPNDPVFLSGQAWHLTKIEADQAWELTAGSPDVIVAVLDSGLNTAHPEFAGRTLPGIDLIGKAVVLEQDDNGHGTSVAGVVSAAGDNGQGSVGVAFGCSLLPVKVMDASGFAPYSVIAEGIRNAVQRGARVINISIAGSTPSATLQQAIDFAWSNDVVVVAAAGNYTGSSLQYPAACRHVLGVSATTDSDNMASFSSHGTHVSLSAPGDGIWTTQRDLNNPYNALRGSSLATPAVAGVVALMISVNPALSNEQVVQALQATAEDLGPTGWDEAYGFGRVNARRAVEAAAALLDPATPLPPTVVLTDIPARQVEAGATLELSARAWADGGLVARVSFYVSAELVADAFVPPYTCSWVAAKAGKFEVRAIVEDGYGIRATSAPVVIEVCAPTTPETPSAGGDDAQDPTMVFTRSTFSGLVVNSNGISPSTSGHLSLKLNASGSFSGRLMLGGGRHGFRGRMSEGGEATLLIARKSKGTLRLELHLKSQSSGMELTGEVSAEDWRSELIADRNVFHSRLNPATQTGRRTFTLVSPKEAVASAAGLGKISASGVTKTKGKLRDNRKFANASTLSAAGEYPFYQSYGKGAEVIIGWLGFPVSANGVEGTVYWVRTGTDSMAAALAATAQ